MNLLYDLANFMCHISSYGLIIASKCYSLGFVLFTNTSTFIKSASITSTLHVHFITGSKSDYRLDRRFEKKKRK